MSWFSRLINALNPSRLDQDLADEVRDHLERRAAGLRERGFGPEEARRGALLRFGNTTRLREESRQIRLIAWLQGTIQDVRYAWRGMGKARMYSVTAVLSLALAIGANTAIFSIVDAAMLRPLPVAAPRQLFRLAFPSVSDPGTPEGSEADSFSYPEYLQFVANVGRAARLALFSSPNSAEVRVFRVEAPIEKFDRAFVSGESFDMLGVRPSIGRLFSVEEDRLPPGRALAVLSYECWQRRFQADPAVVGRDLIIGAKAFEIVGVAQKGFFGVEPGKFVDVWVPGAFYEARALSDPGWHWLQILGRFAPGISAEQVQARLQPSFHDFRARAVQRFSTMPPAIKKQFLEEAIWVHPAATGVSDFRKTFSRPLWIVSWVAAGILLIACTNVASLQLARAEARTAEMAMRISLGAARVRLVRQMLTESLVLSLTAGALGWLLARSLGPLTVAMLSSESNPVQFMLAIDTRVLLFCAGVSSASAALFGLIPAWRASAVAPARCLRAVGSQRGKLRLGSVFVSIQVACAFCLVTVGAAFLFSLGNLRRVPPGFDPHDVAVLTIATDRADQSADPVEWNATHSGERARLMNTMLQLRSGVAGHPSIQAAALAWWPIFQGGGWSQQVILPGKGPSDREEIFYRVSPGYFATLRTPLIAGRDFGATDDAAANPASAIVNEAFAGRYFNRADVLGVEFSYLVGHSPIRCVIVGVAADAHYSSLRSGAEPMVYLPLEASNSFTMYVRSRLALPQVIQVVEQEAHAAGAGTRIRDITTLENIVGNTLLREKLLASVGGVLAFFGLLLAAVGLFGLLSYAVGRRTKEIGIRTALGARGAQIVSLVLADVLGLVTLGFIAGLAAALVVLAVFKSLLYGVRSADPAVTASAAGLFVIVALLAAILPARRAARVDPMLALRDNQQ